MQCRMDNPPFPRESSCSNVSVLTSHCCNVIDWRKCLQIASCLQHVRRMFAECQQLWLSLRYWFSLMFMAYSKPIPHWRWCSIGAHCCTWSSCRDKCLLPQEPTAKKREFSPTARSIHHLLYRNQRILVLCKTKRYKSRGYKQINGQAEQPTNRPTNGKTNWNRKRNKLPRSSRFLRQVECSKSQVEPCGQQWRRSLQQLAMGIGQQPYPPEGSRQQVLPSGQ